MVVVLGADVVEAEVAILGSKSSKAKALICEFYFGENLKIPK